MSIYGWAGLILTFKSDLGFKCGKLVFSSLSHFFVFFIQSSLARSQK